MLAYARLERGRTAGRIEPIELGESDRQASRAGCRGHAEQAGMTLVSRGRGGARRDDGARQSVGRGAGAVQSGRQCVQVRRRPRPTSGSILASRRHGRLAEIARGAIMVRACRRRSGVGCSARSRNRPRRRPQARRASAWGWRLSRRLARDMGGDLRLDENVAAGACFVLSVKDRDPQRTRRARRLGWIQRRC